MKNMLTLSPVDCHTETMLLALSVKIRKREDLWDVEGYFSYRIPFSFAWKTRTFIFSQFHLISLSRFIWQRVQVNWIVICYIHYNTEKLVLAISGGYNLNTERLLYVSVPYNCIGSLDAIVRTSLVRMRIITNNIILTVP